MSESHDGAPSYFDSQSQFDATANALAEAANPGGSDPYGLGTQPESQPEPSITPTPVEGDQGTFTPSKEIDLNQLPEEARLWLQAREREMTGDYTRKTQELAQQRQEAEQAMAFMQALQSDPNFALQAYQQLQYQLSQAGFLAAQEQAAQEQFPPGDPGYGYEEGWGNEPDPYRQELDQIKQWIQHQNEQMQYASAEAHLNNQVASLRSQHPDWSDDDIGRVIDLGFSTGGDLFRAAEQYAGWQQQVISSYMDKKASVQTPAALPQGQGVETPQAPRGEKETRAAALEYLRHNLPG